MRTLEFIRENAPFLGAGLLLTFTSSFGQTFFISIFAGEIRAEFGLSHGAWGGIYAAGTLGSAVVMIWAGVLTDHYRVRVLGPVVLVGLSLACLTMAAVPAVWALVVVIFLLRFTGQSMASHIASVAMARWFVKTRGRALSIAGLGYSLGEAILPLGFVALLALVGWRSLWVVAAGLTLLAVPVTIRLLRLERTPQSVTALSAAAGMDNRHWTRRDALHHWLFWCMVPAILAPSAFVTAFFFQQVHTAEVRGWAHVELVALFPVFTASAVLAMVVSGWAIDRWGSGLLMAVYQIFFAAGFALAGATTSLGLAGVAMALMALSGGMNATVPNAFWAEFYGTRHMGSIKALAMALMVLGSAIGPALTGMLIDRGIDFPDQMGGIALVFVGICVLLLTALRRARRHLPGAAQVDIIGA